MEKYQQLVQMLNPIEEKDLILFNISMEEKAHVVKQYNRALVNAKGDGTDVAQIFLKPLISTYPTWGDTALVFGLCLAREGEYGRAEQSIEYAINNTLGSEAILSIAQEAIRIVRDDMKNFGSRKESPKGKINSSMVSDGDAVIARSGMQAPILMKASSRPEKIKMASDRERRAIMMRSASVGDEVNRDDINVENVRTKGENMRLGVKIVAIVLGIAAVFALVYFGIIPLVNKIRSANDTEKRLDYIVNKLDENKADPEVANILADYAAEFDGVVVESSESVLPSGTEGETVEGEETITSETTEAATPTPEATPTPDVILPVVAETEDTTVTDAEDTAVAEPDAPAVEE